ncbi:hypothetical protein ATANTOWER_028241 [Ataeniobius toweri]|uniref:Uncharacterized protein n=1 Tax=Ataeniobius toweri TaxID=208326 RepID=A0ABU7A333_9TELE|nr:hypothetical protein [Ataeniobius toweri]
MNTRCTEVFRVYAKVDGAEYRAIQEENLLERGLSSRWTSSICPCTSTAKLPSQHTIKFCSGLIMSN